MAESFDPFQDELQFPLGTNFETLLLSLQDHVVHHLFSFFTVDTVLILSKVSHVVQEVCRSYTCEAWNIYGLSHEWFPDPIGFQAAMHVSNAVISGSLALQYFNRERYPGCDMDVYLRVAGADLLGRWFKGQGYRKSLDSESYYICNSTTPAIRLIESSSVENMCRLRNGILEVRNYIKFLVRTDHTVRKMQVQMIIVDIEPIHHILFEYHSTALMNFITSREAVCLFPRSTLVDRISYIAHSEGNSLLAPKGWVKKYSARGYQVVGRRQHGHVPEPVYGKRFVTDELCWTVHFNLNVVKGRGIYRKLDLTVPFEVLHPDSGTVSGSAFLRVAEPLVWQ
ncbi:hypothetical protein NLJ89_g10719 [Agrocybe chaxingu]|uniref:Uncharacterized protein n=1 Tax=Agrocybe chaxingu TaxID=84603 RepID=A0A9W8MSC3_9AGAR|nr:hypothetical protein NLJ89_g10719 [Agrocybe chaxingu]